MPTAVSKEDVLAALRSLQGLTRPVWLFGGIAVDFLVGRWSRPHHDIDLNAFEEDRPVLSEELRAIGFDTEDEGWLTHWALSGKDWRLEVVFLARAEPNTGILVVDPDDPVGVPGRYPLPPHHLDPNRFGELGGVRFRVSSPEGEWLARATGNGAVAGRARNSRVEHDLALLEEVLGPERVVQLRRQVSKVDDDE